MHVQPYLNFNGKCDDAIAFYTSALGATVEMRMTFKESPDQTRITPEMHDKVMHASLRFGGSTMGCTDGGCNQPDEFKGFSLTLTVGSVAEAEDRFAKLAAGGKVNMPLAKTFWSPAFGMAQDKFGVNWMVMVGQ